MTNTRFQFLNWFLLAIVTILFCSFQTTFWFQVVGGIPAPLLWLNVVLYVILFRRPLESILINYALALVLVPFTSMGIGMLWAILLVLSLSVTFVKKRIFWPGVRYFIIASFGITLAYHLTSVTLSHIFEANAVSWNFFSRILELLFTPLWAAPVYWVMTYIDEVSEKDPLPERGVIP